MYLRVLLVSLLASTAFAGSKEEKTLRDFLAQNKSRPPLTQVPENLGGKFKINFSSDDWPKQFDRSKWKECKADEFDFQEIYRAALFPWMKAWREGKADGLLAVATASLEFPKLALSGGQKTESGPVRWTEFPHFENAKTRDEVKSSLSTYFQDFARVEDFKLEILDLRASLGDRFSDDLSLRAATLSGYFDLRAVEKNGARRNDRAPITIQALRTSKSAPWKLKSVAFGNFQVVRNEKPSFVETTVASGLGNLPEHLRLEAIRRGGFALAVGDIRGNGTTAMYMGALGSGILLETDAKGVFHEVKDSGIKPTDRVKSALFADFDNDGKQDLLLVRFAGDAPDAKGLGTMGEELVLYHNLGDGKFERSDDIKKRYPTAYAMPATLADFNRDGLLDVYVGFPGVKDFTSTIYTDFAARKVEAQGIFTNKGSMRFEMSKLVGADGENPKYRPQMVWPHSALAVDFDLDGAPDVLVVDDRGNVSPIYRNDGKGNFAQINRQISVENAGYGMGIAVGDFNNDGIPDLLYTNVTTNAHTRLSNSCKENWEYDGIAGNTKGVRLFKGLPGGKFEEVTDQAGLTWAGEGLAGAEFVDYNNDGLLDIAVSNGLWSGTDEREDLSDFFAMTTEGIVDRSSLDEVDYVTQSPVMRLLLGFQGNVLSGTTGKARPQMAGHQRKRLFRNLGTGKFLEVGFVENIDSTADGYVVVKSDVNKDGLQDILFRNADPGSKDVHYAPVQLFTNKNQENLNFLRLTLKGNPSNSDAIGAEVKAFFAGAWHLQFLLGNNGTGQSEKAVHFGLGKESVVEKLAIRWPSGETTELKNVKAGTYLIEEKGSGIQTALAH